MSAENTPTGRNRERALARGFTILGGVFWIIAAFTGPFIFGSGSLVGAFGIAIYPLVFTVGVLAIGWFYERLVSLILALAAVGTIAWGVIMGWESAVWAIMLAFFIAPTVIAALLFFLAGSEAGARTKSPSGTQALS